MSSPCELSLGAQDGWHARRFAGLASPGHLPVVAMVRLRWWALAVQGAAVAVLAAVTGASASTLSLIGLLALGAASNVLVPRLSRWPAAHVLGATAVFDVMLLTGLLSLAGGPSNPLSVLYLVYVMLAAMAATSAWTWAAVMMSSLGFGLLFFVSLPLPPQLGGHVGEGHTHPYVAHLQGMWLAHTISAAVVARFVRRLSVALNQERERGAQTSRLLGLATLAAGAAHEIGNPLGTIRVAAGELERDLREAGASPDTLRDLALIGDEVKRAHRVLEHMSVGAGELLGEGPVATDLRAFIQRTVASIGSARDRVTVDAPDDQMVRWPVQATMQALTQLVRNAVDASPADQPVRVRATPWPTAEPRSARASGGSSPDGVRIEVVDRGGGMSPATLARIGEPFFTTRPGEGRGLGVFIARSLVEHLGGQVQIESAEGRGTVARVWLPTEVTP